MADDSTDFALLVHACDRYRFLYPGFSASFDANWDFSTPCRYYFATEELPATIHGFKNIRSGRGEWSDRLARLLIEQVKEKYILYFQEDMWLDKPASVNFFTGLFKLVQQQGWKQVKLTSSDVYVTEATKFEIEGFTIAKLDNKLSRFLMSHQVTIWDREFLLAQLHKGEHPWRNERKGTRRLKMLNPEIYQIDYFAENGHPAVNHNKPGALRSSYNTVSQNSMLNERVLPYITLWEKDTQMHEYALKLKRHYDEGITHDGKPKPRKEDVFKRLKVFFKRLAKI